MDCSHLSQFELIISRDVKIRHTEGIIMLKIRDTWEPDFVFFCQELELMELTIASC